jgi:Family of unknown function (DUF6010)
MARSRRYVAIAPLFGPCRTALPSSGVSYVLPVLIGLAYCALNSLIPQQHRRPLNAVIVGGAGAAYLGGGLGPLELVFTALMTYVAFRGLRSWTWIGVGWLLHTAWDVVHHVKGYPLLPFAHDSSFGCAVCDPVIAAWCFAGGPSLQDLHGRWSRRRVGRS